MSPPKVIAARHQSPADTSKAVDQFMAGLEHPLKDAIQSLRDAILAVDSSVAEGIKWNAPSFRTDEYFATMNLRARPGLALVLHLGARARDLPSGGVSIADPAGLLKWLAKDRALVEFKTAGDLQHRIPALQAVLRQWIQYL